MTLAHAYVLLAVAIAFEVVATSALKATHGMTRPVPIVIMVAGYAATFTLLSFVMKVLPLSLTYAVWAGAGTALIAVVGVLYYGEKIDAIGLAGIALIVAGIVVLKGFSKMGG